MVTVKTKSFRDWYSNFSKKERIFLGYKALLLCLKSATWEHNNKELTNKKEKENETGQN